MPKASAKSATKQASLRIPAEVEAKADALLERLLEQPNFNALGLTRADVLRMALVRGLSVLDEEYPPARGSKGKP